ncbi:MAG: asparaginase [Halocynthiibacter sp.]
MTLTHRGAEPLVEIWRGPFLESLHWGHAVVCDAKGEIRQTWGNPEEMILPRSSCKMLQALPLLETGAADAFGIKDHQIALACSSHQGQPMHTDVVQDWLAHLGYTDDDLICGTEMPRMKDDKAALIKTDNSPCRYHNNCSGKHSGFLTVTKHLGADMNYVDPSHPLQIAVKDGFEDLTQVETPGFGIDGCSAPNFGTTVHGLARAMAFFANAKEDASSVREAAAAKLARCMATYPELVAGDTRACTELMQACQGPVALKTGAEAVFIAILPEQGLGVALKIADGATRASECVIAQILVNLGVLDKDHPMTKKRLNAPIKNWDGLETGIIKPTEALLK